MNDSNVLLTQRSRLTPRSVVDRLGLAKIADGVSEVPAYLSGPPQQPQAFFLPFGLPGGGGGGGLFGRGGGGGGGSTPASSSASSGPSGPTTFQTVAILLLVGPIIFLVVIVALVLLYVYLKRTNLSPKTAQ